MKETVAALTTRPNIVVHSGAPIPPLAEMRSLDEVLKFEFPDLVSRMMHDLKLSEEQAHGLFKDMLRFLLYICGTKRTLRPFYPPPAIDEAWHTFLLFTREYGQFCTENFGWYIHHAPLTEAMRKARAAGETKPNLTYKIARSLFAPLSENWAGEAECDTCQSCCPD